MKPSGVRVRRRKATATRQSEIADAAIRIIAEQGTRRFTAHALADEIGVTPGAIFRHFATLDDVVGAVLQRMESRLFRAFPPQARDPIDRLGLFFRQRVELMAQNPAISRLLLTDQLSHMGGAAHAGRVPEFKRRSRAFVRSALREAEAKGLLGGAAGVEEGTVLVLGAILALGHAGTRVSDGPSARRLATRVWNTIEITLRGTPVAKQGTIRTPVKKRSSQQKRKE